MFDVTSERLARRSRESSAEATVADALRASRHARIDDLKTAAREAANDEVRLRSQFPSATTLRWIPLAVPFLAVTLMLGAWLILRNL